MAKQKKSTRTSATRARRGHAPRRAGRTSAGRTLPGGKPMRPRTPKGSPRRPAAPAQSDEQAPPDFLIVGIGASAGGYEALSRLLHALPEDGPVALVVVQHLAAGHDSVLSELLASTSRLPVAQATDGIALRPGRVYVIPPDHELSATRGRLRLGPRPAQRRAFMPIDHFFGSLARYAGTRAVGVILSGTANDGTLGLTEIKAVGGITIAQDPATAKFDGMPRAAIAGGAVDLVLSPENIAAEIVRIAHLPLATESSGPGAAGSADAAPSAGAGAASDDGAAPHGGEHLAEIFKLLRAATGVDFTHYKLPTIRRRLQRRLVLHKLTEVAQYLELLKSNPAEVQALHQDILINVTRFFREPESFQALAKRVFPRMVADRERMDPIRVWVPGCSTGQEAYSVAIALLEFLDERNLSHPVQVFATDISETNIEAARAGVYPENIAADVSPARLRRFFAKTDSHFRITKSVRDLCVFARQDLTRDPPFSRIDLVLCRNVLIYLGPLLQKRLMSVFHYALKPTGYLMLGSAETVGPHADLFAVADKKHRLYVKKGITSHGAAAREPAAYAALTSADRPGLFSSRTPGRDGDGDASGGGAGRAGAAGSATRGPGTSPDPRSAASVHGEATRVLLNRYGPPAVIVDSDFHNIQFRGQTGAFLEPAPGEASLSLLKMAREGMLFGLRSALHEARNREAPARREQLRVRSNGGFRDVTVEVVPLTPTGNDRHYLVIFQDVTASAAHGQAPGAAGDSGAAGRATGKRGARRDRAAQKPGAGDEAGNTREQIRTLEAELAASRDYMQSVIQDMEATNEELQSANEEILSANEELQSTNEELDTAKEELQSTNEELNTLNDELQGRNDELSRVNSDLVNLLANVQIAIVMVAADLSIRRFTPSAERLLNLIPTDVGRPISDIKPNIDCADIDHLITEAVDGVTVKERQCRDRDGRAYTLRVRPYKSLENKIDGAVLTLVEVDESRKYQREALDRADASDRSARVSAERASYAEAVIDVAREPLLVLDTDLVVRAANKAFRRWFALSDRDAQGRSVSEVLGGDGHRVGEGRLSTVLRDVLERDAVEDYEVEQDLPGGGRRTLVVNARRVEGGPGQPALVLLAVGDARAAASAPAPAADGGRRGT